MYVKRQPLDKTYVLTGAAIAAIIEGVLIAVALIGVLLWFFKKKQGRRY